jgi:hypothetical protein
MTRETQYKKALANVLYYQALSMSKEELQPVLFFEEETTEKWTLDKCRIQYVLDQLQFIEGGNLDKEIEETWQLITSKERT